MGIQYSGAIVLPQGGFKVTPALPSSPVINGDIVLLMNGSSLSDQSTYTQNLENIGGVFVDNTESKFGSSSLRFTSATPSYFRIGINESTSIAESQDFTMEAWFKPASTNGYRTLFVIGGRGYGEGLEVFFNNDFGTLLVGNGGSYDTQDVSAQINTSDWNHIAVTRENSNVQRTYVNGINVMTQSNSSAYTDIGSQYSYIGSEQGSYYHYDGWIDGLRVIKDQALYTGTSDITVPTSAF